MWPKKTGRKLKTPDPRRQQLGARTDALELRISHTAKAGRGELNRHKHSENLTVRTFAGTAPLGRRGGTGVHGLLTSPACGHTGPTRGTTYSGSPGPPHQGLTLEHNPCEHPHKAKTKDPARFWVICHHDQMSTSFPVTANIRQHRAGGTVPQRRGLSELCPDPWPQRRPRSPG